MSDLLSPFIAFWFLTCAYSLWRGGGPERFVATLFLLAVPASIAAFSLGWRHDGVNLGLVIVDVAMLAGLFPIAWAANRFWPLAITGMQIILVVGHVLKLAQPTGLPPLLYWLTSAFWAYPMLALLALGTIRHQARTKKLGSEPSWSAYWQARM
jgi:hypothetical protein